MKILVDNASQLSASQIGLLAGVSKNAVIGKAYRLGIALTLHKAAIDTDDESAQARDSPQQKRITMPATRRKASAPPQEIRPEPESSIEDIAFRSGAALAIAHLSANHCRWPFGDPHDDDFHYCCATVAPDTEPRYCLRHLKVAVPTYRH